MATAIIPKSVMRENYNLQSGYGEIPAFMKDGKVHYALPNGTLTTDKRKAQRMAERLDSMIRSSLQSNPKWVLH